METTIDVAMFDMHGTLVDTSGIISLLFEEPPRYVEFYEATVSCPPKPEVVRDLYHQLDLGRRVFVSTGWPETYRVQAQWWLTYHSPGVEQVLMRPEHDRRSAYVLKKRRLEIIRQNGLNPVAAWDDDPRAITMYEDEGLESHLVPGWRER